MASILALDVGNVRVGVARAHTIARLAEPLSTLEQSEETFWDELKTICDANEVELLVIGLPRNLNGDDTAQTEIVRQFAEQAKKTLNVPYALQDEALTSVKAEDELNSRGRTYAKADIDAFAAMYILEDYLQQEHHA